MKFRIGTDNGYLGTVVADDADALAKEIAKLAENLKLFAEEQKRRTKAGKAKKAETIEAPRAHRGLSIWPKPLAHRNPRLPSVKSEPRQELAHPHGNLAEEYKLRFGRIPEPGAMMVLDDWAHVFIRGGSWASRRFERNDALEWALGFQTQASEHVRTVRRGFGAR